MNALKGFGLPNAVIGIVQHMETHEPKHHDKISNIFKRFLVAQIGENAKYIDFRARELDANKLLRLMDAAHVDRQQWKTQRGCVLVDNIVQASEETLTVEGFLKGNCINPNQLVHITGFDDYQIEKIEIRSHPRKKSRNQNKHMEEELNLIQYSTGSESLYPFSNCLLYTSPSPRDKRQSRMPSSA